MCLKDLRDEFIYDCECRHLAKGSLRNYKAATRFLLEYLELKQITELEDVRPRHIRDLMKEKQDAGSTSRYINDLLKVWRTWFNYLVNEGYLEERDNPAKKVKCLRQPRTIIDTFTVAEMKRMIQFYDGKDFLEVRNKTIIMLLFDTGMRCNEMILMEPEAVHGFQYAIERFQSVAEFALQFLVADSLEQGFVIFVDENGYTLTTLLIGPSHNSCKAQGKGSFGRTRSIK